MRVEELPEIVFRNPHNAANPMRHEHAGLDPPAAVRALTPSHSATSAIEKNRMRSFELRVVILAVVLLRVFGLEGGIQQCFE